MLSGNADNRVEGSKPKSTRAKGGAEKPRGDRKIIKRTDLFTVTLVITLNVNGLNALAKRPILSS